MKGKGEDFICGGLKSDWTDKFINKCQTPNILGFIKSFPHNKEGSLDTQQSFFTKGNEHSKSTVARKKKPFTDAEEIIKLALKIAARMLDDKNRKKLILSLYQIIRGPEVWKS
ncbi:hypothetical protein RF11_12144 [Thelohanellus kitauei]|uniref:Uncharacterized protein n=1 Tax=Thelohanellus kitauei TaxID=669202 RepID=A0A0C2MEW6_THEKT|nr:hypothetical protein RF11_12144 [Thelohanellus kitauei]